MGQCVFDNMKRLTQELSKVNPGEDIRPHVVQINEHEISALIYTVENEKEYLVTKSYILKSSGEIVEQKFIQTKTDDINAHVRDCLEQAFKKYNK